MQEYVPYFSSFIIININGIKLRKTMCQSIQVKINHGFLTCWIFSLGLNGLTKDQSSCKIIATMSNGTIKTLCDTKENISKSESVSESSDKKLSDLGTTTLFPRIVPNTFHSHQDIKQNQNFDDCNCLVFNDQGRLL